MSYRFVDHTAELQLELEASTREGVFEEAVVALGDVLAGDGMPEGAEEAREVQARADDDPTLLASWLDELVFLAESEGLVPRHVERLDLAPGEVTGVVSFVHGAPPHLVKGVTYHDLVLAYEEGAWRARAVLDV